MYRAVDLSSRSPPFFTAHCFLPAVYCLLFTAHRLLACAYCLLLKPLSTARVYCPFFTAHCLLPTIYLLCLLSIAHCPMSVAHRLLPTVVHCLLPTVYCSLCTVHYVLYCPLCTVHYLLRVWAPYHEIAVRMYIYISFGGGRVICVQYRGGFGDSIFWYPYSEIHIGGVVPGSGPRLLGTLYP
jgi:hypothetical protein